MWKDEFGDTPSLDQVTTFVEILNKAILKEVSSGGEVVLTGVGKLKLKSKTRKNLHNPKTGEKHASFRIARPVFTPIGQLKAHILSTKEILVKTN